MDCQASANKIPLLNNKLRIINNKYNATQVQSHFTMRNGEQSKSRKYNKYCAVKVRMFYQ